MWDFVVGMFAPGNTALEWTAAALSILGVVLTIRRSLWSYAFGIPGVALYAWIFYEGRLYSEALLYVYYFAMLTLGVRWWLQGRASDGLVVIEETPPRERLLLAALTLAAALGLGAAMARFTDADIPFLDAGTTAMALAAQYLQSRRRVETYPLWAVYNAISIGVMYYKGWIPTMAVYGVFLALSFWGLAAWARAYRAGRPVAA